MPMLHERSAYYSRPDVFNIEFIHATFVTHRFARHVHDYFVLGFVEAGLQTFSYRGASHATTNGGIILLNPDEAHTGEAATPDGFVYKALYPSADLLRSIAEQITGKRAVLPFFSTPIIYDVELTRQLLSLHQTLVTPASTLAGESEFLNVFGKLINRYADIRYTPSTVGQERLAVRRVRDFIETHYAENVSLTHLAALVSFSPYYLARVFNAEVGIPIHAYLESVRIRHAQHLLSQGQSVAEVAYSTGFAHQSHFTHRFKRFVGITPGQYVKQRKIMQDARSKPL